MRQAIAVIVVLGMAVVQAAGFVEDFSGRGDGEIAGQGTWVTGDDIYGIGTSTNVAAGIGLNGARGLEGGTDQGGLLTGSAAVDIGEQIGDGWTAGYVVKLLDSGGFTDFWLGTDTLADGTASNTFALDIQLSSSGAQDNRFGRYSFRGSHSDTFEANSGDVSAVTGFVGEWVEVQITVDAGPDGITGGTVRARNLDVPNGWQDLGTYRDFPAGFGTGNTYIAIGTWGAVIDQVYAFPEPASLALLAMGGAAMLARRRR